MTDSTSQTGQENFYKPGYWGTWIMIGLLRVLANLSLENQVRVGRLLGRIAYVFVPRRRKITEVNTRLCFPELSSEEQKEFVKKCLIENAIGVIEIARSWFADAASLSAQLEIEGLENLKRAKEKGRGVLMIGAHYSCLDLGSVMLSQVQERIFCMYRPQKNRLIDKIMRDSRLRHAEVVDRQDMRTVIRVLKKGEIVWYAPDQDYGAEVSVFAPFFGVNAATIKTTAKLAQINNSPVVMISYHRKPDNSGYILRFSEELEGYPVGDEVTDAARINAELEREIKHCPEQYMWVHRRFKTRPPGEAGFY